MWLWVKINILYVGRTCYRCDVNHVACKTQSYQKTRYELQFNHSHVNSLWRVNGEIVFEIEHKRRSRHWALFHNAPLPTRKRFKSTSETYWKERSENQSWIYMNELTSSFCYRPESIFSGMCLNEAFYVFLNDHKIFWLVK